MDHRKLLKSLGQLFLASVLVLIIWFLGIRTHLELAKLAIIIAPYIIGWAVVRFLSIYVSDIMFVMFVKGAPLADVFKFPNIIYASIFFVYCVLTMAVQWKYGIWT
jgi:hypothetical protein